MTKKKKQVHKQEKPTVNKELDGFNIEIDSFGEIRTSYDIDKINSFLNENLEDKKLIDRKDLKKKKSKKKGND